MKPQQKTYFPSLDGLRFICAMIIVMFHMEGIKFRHGQEVSERFLSYRSDADIDVSLFFVLSGFLITFLLLREKQNTGTILFKNYYIRRVLKIWPLYYFIMIIGFFLLPYFGHAFYSEYSCGLSDHFTVALIGYLFFLPPILLGGYMLPESMGVTWTIRVEEVFYLAWPFIIRRSKNFIKVSCIIIVSTIFIRDSIVISANLLKNNPDYHKRLLDIAILFAEYRFSCMAIGGIAAYIFITNKENLLQFLFKKSMQILVYSVLFLMLMLRVRVPLMNQEFYSVLIAYMVLNLAANPASIIRLNYKWMTYLGTMAYGIYLYHPIMRILSLEAVMRLFNSKIIGWQMEVSYYSMTIASTLLMAILSHTFIEKPFLNLKKKFSFVNS
jgi:peptidoglycan/LPS O-acetylase OafA/YrhL